MLCRKLDTTGLGILAIWIEHSVSASYAFVIIVYSRGLALIF